MLDLSHIPDSQQDIKIFTAPIAASTPNWQTWQKPRKCQWVWIMAIGGAGGGGGGSTNNLFVYSTGGGSGAVHRALFNASHLPDTLYIQVGIGGAGGSSAIAGSPGTRSFISIAPGIASATNNIAGSGAAGAAGGTSGTATNAAGETAFTSTNGAFVTLANFITIAGVTAAGSGISQAPDITPLTSQITCPGAGGSSGNISALSGGSILSTNYNSTITGGVGTAISGSIGGSGANGITSYKPFFSTGGAGGGNSISGSGGNGGNGGIGSGGGGGGGFNSFLSGTVGGTGGKGGDGLVVIISF